jgi:hypothetical protein
MRPVLLRHDEAAWFAVAFGFARKSPDSRVWHTSLDGLNATTCINVWIWEPGVDR